ncbi:expansin-like protein [Cladochytrium replicatum]|nr:expansin-like protein [Cladochytrium replicatum]
MVASRQQCGGSGWTGPTCCTSGNVCQITNAYYSQCIPGSGSGSSSSKTTTYTSATSKTTQTSKTTVTTPASSSTRTTVASSSTTSKTTTTTTTVVPTGTHTQAPYPSVSASTCGSWTLVDNVCCPSYCKNDLQSENCLGCGSADCVSTPSSVCKSGTMFPEVKSLTDNEAWHFSRSTHFGLTNGGACGFGMYGLCSTATDAKSQLGTMCDAFCKSYPQLCADPKNVTFRGNFAAPNGDYYSQFWPSLPGDRDNYLSCGECFELVRTKKDGTDYQPGEVGYSSPVVLTVVDSCPCSANSKWCCGPGVDHCGEVSGFKYGCPLPSDSIHLDLSDIAMSRLQAGSLVDGVIPTRYRRTMCPTLGNAYLWLRQGASTYYMALSVVNTAGVGSVVNIEIQGANTTTWTALVHDPNYTTSRPQERYGSWTIPQGTGPFNLPIAVRVTGASGDVFTSSPGITSFTAPTGADPGFYYIDLGTNFKA